MSNSIHSAAVSNVHDDESPKELASRLLLPRLKSIMRLLKTAARDWRQDDEHVHHLRVSSRRALATIHFFQDVIPESQVCWFLKQMKAVLRATRQARELDVLIKEKHFRCCDSAKRLRRNWKSKRKDAQKSIIGIQQKLTHKDRFRKHIRKLKNNFKCDASDNKSIRQESGKGWCLARFGETCRQFTDIKFESCDSGSLHRLRIETKQLRYTLEVVEQATNIPKSAELKMALAEMQELLGQLQDHVTGKVRLQESLNTAKKSRDRHHLRKLIEKQNHQISDHMERFQGWSNSEEGRRITRCLQEIFEALRL